MKSIWKALGVGVYWSRALVTNGLMKGYAYAKTDLKPVLPSLDDVKSWPEGKRVLFKRLDNNWYLFLMSP